jgi:DNA polymerase III subunit delta'
MSFDTFYGNTEVVTRLREMLARDRFPHSIILAGPAGAGKYTLAQMVAKAMNCLSPPVPETPDGLLALKVAEESPLKPKEGLSGPHSAGLPDFCGRCESCLKIAESDDLAARFAEAVEARENLRETDKKETRIFVQSHPDVLVIPPDPPQMMIKVDQVRQVIGGIYRRPIGHGRKLYIFTASSFMKEAANSLLKVLEEPPEYATLFLLTENPGELLTTIRSRCVTFTLAPLPAEEVERYLKTARPEWNATQRALVARLSEGAIGRARGFDLAAYGAARKDALIILHSGIGDGASAGDHGPLFRVTETYRAGAEGREKTDQLIRTLYTLFEDILVIKAGAPQMVRNADIAPELQRIAAAVDFRWLALAAERLGEVESGMRRNLLRSLSLDAFAVGLES